jgi:hypothetical protein
MMSLPQQYLTALAERLAADGCEVHWENWDSASVLIGYRADFRVQWLMSRLHLYTVAAAFPEVTKAMVGQFALSARSYAGAHKPGLPSGFQTGAAVFACLVSDYVQPEALDYAASEQGLGSGVFARPVVVDTDRRAVAAFRRTGFMGAIFGPYLRRKITLYFDGTVGGQATQHTA